MAHRCWLGGGGGDGGGREPVAEPRFLSVARNRQQARASERADRSSSSSSCLQRTSPTPSHIDDTACTEVSRLETSLLPPPLPNLDNAKHSFYRSFSGIFGAVGRTTSIYSFISPQNGSKKNRIETELN